MDMEDPPKLQTNHNKTKNMPVLLKIGAGAGSLGIGGIVLLGGALVTATLVSALAFKTKRQPMNKSPPPSPENSPNKLELMMKISKDTESIKDFSSNGTTHLTETETKPTQNSILVDSGDVHEDIPFPGTGEDQESTSTGVCVESVSQREESSNGYESIPEMGFQPTEEISNSSELKDDGGEDKKPLASDEVVKSIEEGDIFKVALGDDVPVAVIEEEEEEETRFTLVEEAIEEEKKGSGCVSQKDSLDEVVLEKNDGSLIDTVHEDQIGREENQETQYESESFIQEEVVACVDSVDVDDSLEEDYTKDNRKVLAEMNDYQVASEDVNETFSNEEHSGAVADQEEEEEEDEIPHVESTEEDDVEENVTAESDESSDGTGGVAIWPDEELKPETNTGNNKIEEHNVDSKEVGSGKPRLPTWSSVLVVMMCLSHWYFGLPFLHLALLGSFLFVFLLLGFSSRATYLANNK